MTLDGKIKNISLLLCLLVVFLQNNAYSQQDHSFIHSRINAPYINSYFTDLDDFLVRPLSWDRKKWITATSITGAGLGLYFHDKLVRDFFIRNNTDFLIKTNKWFLDPLGIGLWTAPLIGLMYFTGNERAKGTSLAVIKAYGYGVGAAISLKYLLQRARPSHLNPANPYYWDGLFGKWKYDAFPSGHSTLSFAVATVIASEYKEKPWVVVLCYSLATLASLSRIQHGDHWPSDVLIGSALGFGIGKFIYRTSKQANQTSFKLLIN